MESFEEDIPLGGRQRIAPHSTSETHHQSNPTGVSESPATTEARIPSPVPDPRQSDEEDDDEIPAVDVGRTSKHAERYEQQTPYFRGTEQNAGVGRKSSGVQGRPPRRVQEPGGTIGASRIWPVYTNIVPPEVPGGHLGLKAQSASVQSVLRRSIVLVFVSFCFEHAFAYASNENQCADDKKYIRGALVKAAHELHFTEIESRLVEDDRYARGLGAIIQNRIDDWRSKLRKNASCAVHASYGLHSFKNVAELEAHVKEILRRATPNYRYIFAQDEHNNPIYTKPFLHPIFAQVLHETFFSSSSQMGQKCLGAFEVDKDSGVYELPAPLVALAATAVFSALDALHAAGAHRKFSADAYADIYLDNLETLTNLSRETGTKDSYHPLMAKLFNMSQSGGNGAGLHRQVMKESGVTEINLED